MKANSKQLESTRRTSGTGRFRRWANRGLLAAIALGTVGAIVFALLPKPVGVDLQAIDRGELVVTVDEEGQTRVRERYVVSSPLAGRLLRIELDPGDEVVAGKTLLAVLEPTNPTLLDARSLAEAEARVKRSEKTLERAGPDLEQAKVRYQFAQSEFRRAQELREQRAITSNEYEEYELLERQRAEELKAAQLAVQIATFELELAKAALIHTDPEEEAESPRVEIHSPIDGTVLKVLQESSAIVTPGTELLELGARNDLEIEVDVLSSDAVKITPGDRVILEHWGGDQPLNARVKRVEPQAFTKISALGVEEQRVYVIADFTDPLELWNNLGDGYRVEARMVIWENPDVLKVPTSALFRQGDDWAVFVDEGGVARVRLVEIGRRNALESQVLSGLEEGDRVVVHPSDKVVDGVKIEQR